MKANSFNIFFTVLLSPYLGAALPLLALEFQFQLFADAKALGPESVSVLLPFQVLFGSVINTKYLWRPPLPSFHLGQPLPIPGNPLTTFSVFVYSFPFRALRFSYLFWQFIKTFGAAFVILITIRSTKAKRHLLSSATPPAAHLPPNSAHWRVQIVIATTGTQSIQLPLPLRL